MRPLPPAVIPEREGPPTRSTHSEKGAHSRQEKRWQEGGVYQGRCIRHFSQKTLNGIYTTRAQEGGVYVISRKIRKMAYTPRGRIHHAAPEGNAWSDRRAQEGGVYLISCKNCKMACTFDDPSQASNRYFAAAGRCG